MKPETTMALIKMAEKARRIQTEDYSGRWIKLGYVGAVLTSLLGVYFISSGIAVISGGNDRIIGALYLFVTLVFTLMPWYFILRYNFNRNIQLLCEAILSVDRDQSDVAALPVAVPDKEHRGRQPDLVPRRVIAKSKVVRKRK